MIILSLLVIFSNKSINASTINESILVNDSKNLSAAYANTLNSSRNVKIAVSAGLLKRLKKETKS